MTTVQIMRVRPSGLRSAAVVNDDGSIRPPPLAVKFPADCAEAATAGSVWDVAGNVERRCYVVNGVNVAEELLVATEVKYVRPSGELLARWISANIEGVGEVIARRLVRAFPDLNEIVRQGDVEALSRVSGVNAARAQSLIRKWPSEALCGVLEWLQASGLPMGLAERLVRVYKDDALAKLKTNQRGVISGMLSL
ncbi:MAG: helix-hairpin-helix domain-containing protein, partial [Lentisphaerota bacterium]